MASVTSSLAQSTKTIPAQKTKSKSKSKDALRTDAAIKPPIDYVIGLGDELAINVWKDSELSKTMPVRPDGKISMPLIGDIQAAGLTSDKLRDEIIAALAPYVSHPEVNVVVEQIRSRSFNVMGQVNKPGSFELIRPTTVLDALALAGGLQEFARAGHIYVLRPSDSGTKDKILKFDYRKVIRGHHLEENVYLNSGDTVVVP
jgi:polysaccharide export outer membrane protein